MDADLCERVLRLLYGQPQEIGPHNILTWVHLADFYGVPQLLKRTCEGRELIDLDLFEVSEPLSERLTADIVSNRWVEPVENAPELITPVAIGSVLMSNHALACAPLRHVSGNSVASGKDHLTHAALPARPASPPGDARPPSPAHHVARGAEDERERGK